MTLASRLDDDAAIFVRVEDFGETITYTPRDGSPVSIPALVKREGPSPETEGNFGMRPHNLTIYIRNDATYGRTSIDTGGDSVTLARRVGDATTTTLLVRKVDNSNTGMWKLTVG